MTYDIDSRLYEEQEANGLRLAGWVCIEPEKVGRRSSQQCKGADESGCPVFTPNVRCRYCRKTLRLRREQAA